MGDNSSSHPTLFAGLAGHTVNLWDLDGRSVAQADLVHSWPDRDAIKIARKASRKKVKPWGDNADGDGDDVNDEDDNDDQSEETDIDNVFITQVKSVPACSESIVDSASQGMHRVADVAAEQRKRDVDTWKMQVDTRCEGMFAAGKSPPQMIDLANTAGAAGAGAAAADDDYPNRHKSDGSIFPGSDVADVDGAGNSYAERCPIFNPPSLEREDRITLQLLEKYHRMGVETRQEQQQQQGGRDELMGAGYYKFRRTAQLATKLSRKGEACRQVREREHRDAQHRALRSTMWEAQHHVGRLKKQQSYQSRAQLRRQGTSSKGKVLSPRDMGS